MEASLSRIGAPAASEADTRRLRTNKPSCCSAAERRFAAAEMFLSSLFKN